MAEDRNLKLGMWLHYVRYEHVDEKSPCLQTMLGQDQVMILATCENIHVGPQPTFLVKCLFLDSPYQILLNLVYI